MRFSDWVLISPPPSQSSLKRIRHFASKDWQWHEAELNYDNARLPEALMACGRVTNDDAMVKTGIDVLEWLRDMATKAFRHLGQHRGSWNVPADALTGTGGVHRRLAIGSV